MYQVAQHAYGAELIISAEVSMPSQPVQHRKNVSNWPARHNKHAKLGISVP